VCVCARGFSFSLCLCFVAFRSGEVREGERGVLLVQVRAFLYRKVATRTDLGDAYGKPGKSYLFYLTVHGLGIRLTGEEVV